MTRKNEQQIADELDALITAKLHNQPPPPIEHVPEDEAQLAMGLVEMATAVDPDPAFIINLTAQLERAALKEKQQSSRLHREQPTTRSIFTMKKTIFAIGAVAMILIVAGLVFWNQPQTEPTVADLPTSATATTESEDADTGTAVANADLPTLPAIKSDPGAAMGGFGGGGGDMAVAESAPPRASGGGGAADTEMGMSVPFHFTDVFSGTEFILGTALPTEPTAALVQKYTYENLTAVEAQEIATRFGFTGTIYEQVIPVYDEPSPDADFVAYEPPPSYYAFDGSRQLIMQQNSFYYMDQVLQEQIDYEQEVPNATAVAEAFLNETGLLDFPHVTKPGFIPGEVIIYRQIGDPQSGGYISNMADYYLQVTPSGEIAYLSNNQYKKQIDTLGEYPLISPEEAWDLILGGVITNNIPYNFVPQMIEQPIEQPEEMPTESFEDMLHWYNEPIVGQEGHFYGSLTAYQPIDGNGRPRLDYMGYILEGSDADLQAIAENPYEMIYIVGTTNADRTITVNKWELMDRNTQPVFLEGTTSRDGRDMIVTGLDGQTFILANAPDDLPTDFDVYVFGWPSRETGGDYPILDWQSIDERIIYTEEPLPPMMEEPMMYEPYVYQSVTIDEVVLEYYYMAQISEEILRGAYNTPPSLQLPVWKFMGQTDNGDSIEFYVQAVSPDYLEN